MKSIAAIIVTYNRRELLAECIRAILSQKDYVPDILVIDNDSSDGTEESLQQLIESGKVTYFNTGSNLGGAGGFHYGIQKAVELGFDYLWIMDDDCIPTDNALSALWSAAKSLSGFGFLSSKVLWKDGSICEMNVQRKTLTRDVQDFKKPLIPVVMSSFVSLFLPSSVVKEVGLPIKEFFLWTDDWEYTRRISRRYACYLVTGSEVIHKSKANIGADISGESVERLDRFNYLYRNDVVLYRREGLKGFAYESVRLTGHVVRVLLKSKDYKLRRIRTIYKGTAAGLRFHPKIEYVSTAGKKSLRVLEAFGEPIADGGQEAFVFGVMEKMDLTGMTIDCLTAYDCRSEHYRSLVERLGGRVYALNLPFAPGKSRENIRKPFREFLKKHPYDVVHIHSGSISVLAIMASASDRAGTKRVIVHSHVDGENDNLKHKVLRLVASLSMRHHVDIYCACSRNAADWKFEPKYAAITHIVKNGIDTERFKYNPYIRANMRDELGLKDMFVIGHVGRFNYQKNHEFLINVFDIVSRRDPSAHLLLVGDGDDMKKIRKIVTFKGLEERVTFIGSVTNVQDYLQAMDVFVLPSRFEGLGIAAIEAQCTGLPVTASDTVPRDAMVTDMEFLPLSGSYDQWADHILSYKSVDRRDNSQKIKSSGFDVCHTANLLRRMYTFQKKS